MATNKRWDGAAFIDLTVKKRWDGVSWVDLTISKRWDGATWVDFFAAGSGFNVTISPGTASGSVFDPLPAPLNTTVTSNPVTATPSGGTGPYTYSWAKVSGDSAVSANSPTAATTDFSAIVPRDGERSAIWRVTVTDSLSATASADVSVTLTYTSDA